MSALAAPPTHDTTLPCADCSAPSGVSCRADCARFADDDRTPDADESDWYARKTWREEEEV